jgi:hypothetical protein
MAVNYWLDLFTWKTWQKAQEHGFAVTGFRKNKWVTMQRVKPGDFFICYLTGVSRWIGLLEVTGKPFLSEEKIWDEDVFPARVEARPVITLTPDTAVPIFELKEQLSYFKDMKSPHAWTGKLRGSPAAITNADAQVIIKALKEAERAPIIRPVDKKKLERIPPVFDQEQKPVTIPEDDEELEVKGGPGHEEIQWLLLKLGSAMKMGLWVARNDKNKSFDNARLGEMKGNLDTLPANFDQATNKTIELIDVLWVKGNNIVAAFEVEHTSAIYSGLLRMADLISMQPNLNISLYIVAPDSRREKVLGEIGRPTFANMDPPLGDRCQFISYSALKKLYESVSRLSGYVSPDIIETIAESSPSD